MKTRIPALLPLGWAVSPKTMPSGEENGGASSDFWDVCHCGVPDDVTVGDHDFQPQVFSSCSCSPAVRSS